MKTIEILNPTQPIEEGVFDNIRIVFQMMKLSQAISEELSRILEQQKNAGKPGALDEYRATVKTRLEEIRQLHYKMHKTRSERAAIDKIIDGFLDGLKSVDPDF